MLVTGIIGFRKNGWKIEGRTNPFLGCRHGIHDGSRDVAELAVASELEQKRFVINDCRSA